MNFPIATRLPNPVLPQPSATPGQYLTFRLQGEVYGVDILRVREIIEYAKPTALPMMPAFVHGVIRLRDHVVPVIDLAQRFGAAATQLHRRTCIVIIEVAGGETTQDLGVLVEAVDAVLDIDAPQIEMAPSFGVGLQREFIQGMARLDQGFVILLDVGRVLTNDDLTSLAQVASGGPAAA